MCFSKKPISHPLTNLTIFINIIQPFFLANAPDKTHGVAICVAKSLAYSLSQTITDPEGRYIMVKGDLEGTIVTLLSYYALNRDQLSFFQDQLQQLSHLFEGMLLNVEDYNITLDSSLDKTCPPGS